MFEIYKNVSGFRNRVKYVAIFLPPFFLFCFVYLFIEEWIILMTPLEYRYLSLCFIGGRGGEKEREK